MRQFGEQTGFSQGFADIAQRGEYIREFILKDTSTEVSNAWQLPDHHG